MNIFNHPIKNENPRKCLIVKCDGEVQTRGLCMKCYSTARLMMTNGDVTEKQLLEKNMILPAKPKNDSLFKAQFKE